MDKKTITKQIRELEVLQVLTDSYAQISSSRMKSTRDTVVLSRDFLYEIQQIFKELQSSYRDEFVKLARKKGFKKGDKITFLAHNGRKVAVFLSTNTGFYGNLIKKVFTIFSEDMQKENMEATIVGKLGLNMFKEVFPDKSYSYFDLSDYTVDRDKMADLIKHLVQYEEIHIYFGKFKSIVNQGVDKVVISAETQLEEGKKEKATKYLFEPSLEEILMFFETEMFSSVFEQTIRESQLAKFASRMLAMDQAGVKIRELLETTKLQDSRMTHYINNRKQLSYFSSVIARTNSI